MTAEITREPICAVTGRIAGDPSACGDCDPCGAALKVSEPVKRLIAERIDFANLYADAAGQRDQLSTRLQRADRLLERARSFMSSIRSARADICIDRDKLCADITAYREDDR